MHIPLCLDCGNRTSWFIHPKPSAWDILWICFWRRVSPSCWWEMLELEKQSSWWTSLPSYLKSIWWPRSLSIIIQHLLCCSVHSYCHTTNFQIILSFLLFSESYSTSSQNCELDIKITTHLLTENAIQKHGKDWSQISRQQTGGMIFTVSDVCDILYVKAICLVNKWIINTEHFPSV